MERQAGTRGTGQGRGFHPSPERNFGSVYSLHISISSVLGVGTDRVSNDALPCYVRLGEICNDRFLCFGFCIGALQLLSELFRCQISFLLNPHHRWMQPQLHVSEPEVNMERSNIS